MEPQWKLEATRPDHCLEKQIKWRMNREFSYGLMAELSYHQIDFVNWILKNTPQKAIVMGGINYWKDGRETYDNTKEVYQYSEGIKATYSCFTYNPKDDCKIMVMEDKGTFTIYYDKAWFYPEGAYKPNYGEVDGLLAATTNWIQGKGTPLDVRHLDPTKQALIDFKDAFINNTTPLSNVITGAKAAYAVDMGIKAMDSEKIVHWDNTNFIL